MRIYQHLLVWKKRTGRYLSRGLNAIAWAAPDYKKLEADFEAKHQEIIGLQRELQEVRGYNAVQDAKLREAKAQYEEQGRRVSEQKAEIEGNRTKLTNLSSQVARLTQANAEFGAQVEKLTQDSTELRRKYDEERGKYAELERKLQVQIDGAGHHKEEIRRLKRSSWELVAETYIAANPRDFVISVDEKDRIVAASERALKKLGYGSVEEISGIDVYSLIKKGEDVRASLRKKIMASLSDSKKERLREVLPNLAVENPCNGRKYNLNAVVIPRILGELTGHSRHYLGSMIVEEPWRQTRLRRRLEKLEMERKRKEEQANAEVQDAHTLSLVGRFRKTITDIMKEREINPDEPESPPENETAPKQS